MSTERIKTSALVPSGELTIVESVEELVDETRLHRSAAEKILHVLKRREANRMGETRDTIVLLEEWAYEDWSDVDVADNGTIVAEFVDDYSDGAYIVEGAAEILEDAIDDRSVEEVTDSTLTSIVSTIDETGTEFHDEIGEAYLPKKGVSQIIAFEGDL